jgi:hypothetical protein
MAKRKWIRHPYKRTYLLFLRFSHNLVKGRLLAYSIRLPHTWDLTQKTRTPSGGVRESGQATSRARWRPPAGGQRDVGACVGVHRPSGDRVRHQHGLGLVLNDWVVQQGLQADHASTLAAGTAGSALPASTRPWQPAPPCPSGFCCPDRCEVRPRLLATLHSQQRQVERWPHGL